MDYEALWQSTKIDITFDVGEGRKTAFDKKKIFINAVTRLKDNLKVDISKAPSLLKAIGIKINIHGCRMNTDSTFRFGDFNYDMDQISKALMFNKTGIETASDVPTPTRIGRIFAEETYQYLVQHTTVEPSLYQPSTRVDGLPRELHFLNACYVPGLNDEDKQALLKLAKNFDLQVSRDGYQFEKGFFIRMFIVFNGTVDIKILKNLVKTAFEMEIKGIFSKEMDMGFLIRNGFDAAARLVDQKKGIG
jgi:hypothetical protein